MNTYRYRLRFFTHSKGVIEHAEQKYEICVLNECNTELSCLDSESIGGGKEFVLSWGGYSSEEEAFQSGIAIKNSLLLVGAKLRIGIDAGKENSSGWLNPSIRNDIFESQGVKIINNVHGVSVYSEEHPVKTFSASAEGLICSSNVEKFGSKLSDCLPLSEALSKKQKLSLELYGAYHFEKSIRARFLTLILGIEALLEPVKRSEKEMELVDRLVDSAKKSELGEKEKQSILGSLQWLYKDSISQSLRKMAQNHLHDKSYDGLSSIKFIAKCYEVRSKLVHTGAVDEKSVNIGGVDGKLGCLLVRLGSGSISPLKLVGMSWIEEQDPIPPNL